MTPSRPTRRAVLAACGTALFAGCADRSVLGTSAPPVRCSPTDYSWPAYGYDAARTGRVPSRDLPQADAEVRRFSQTGQAVDSGGSADAPPVVGDGVAYVAGDVRIEARDAETGERLWGVDPDDGVGTSPTLACGAVYVSTLNETLALDPAGGDVLWRADVGASSGVSGSPVVLDDALYVVGGGVTALDAETGEERWTAPTKQSAHGVAVADRVYVGEGSNGTGAVSAFTRDGDDWWRTTEAGRVYAPPAVGDDAVYAVSKTGRVTALDAENGSVRWNADVESGVYEPPAVAGGRVFVGAGNGSRTTAFDAATGDRLWTFRTGVSRAAPVAVGDRVLTSGANTGIYLVDAETGEELRRWKIGNVGSQAVVAGGRLFYHGWNVSDTFVVG